MNHKELKAWQQSIQLVTDIYRITSNFPKPEQFGLSDQIRRSAVSIPSNIAEGAGRESTKEYIRFLNISIGSIAELETQLIIAQNLHFLKDESLLVSIKQIRKLTIGLRKSLKASL